MFISARVRVSLLLAAMLPVAAQAGDASFNPPPKNWLAMGGQGYELCDVGVDAQLLKAGQRNLSIACSIPQNPVLRQSFEAGPFWGKRVRLSVWIKTENVEPLAVAGNSGGAGLFLGNQGSPTPLVQFRVTGTSDWQQRELVVDVGRETPWLLIGLVLNGTGQVWVRDFKFEEVTKDIPVTPVPVR